MVRVILEACHLCYLQLDNSLVCEKMSFSQVLFYLLLLENILTISCYPMKFTKTSVYKVVLQIKLFQMKQVLTVP